MSPSSPPFPAGLGPGPGLARALLDVGRKWIEDQIGKEIDPTSGLHDVLLQGVCDALKEAGVVYQLVQVWRTVPDRDAPYLRFAMALKVDGVYLSAHATGGRGDLFPPPHEPGSPASLAVRFSEEKATPDLYTIGHYSLLKKLAVPLSALAQAWKMDKALPRPSNDLEKPRASL